MERSDRERISEPLESIMVKCGGLPKVIAAITNHYNIMMASLKETCLKLKIINDSFMEILEQSDSLRGLFSWIQSYLETRNDELKPCIFYLPVFPIGHNIRITRLNRRWMAEGYIRDKSSTTEKRLFYELPENRILSELSDSSVIQVQTSSKPLKCQVNGFLHEYINSRPMEDNLVLALEGPCSMRPQCAGAQHLTIRDNWNRDMNVFGSIDFSRLRSLTVFGECRSFMFDPAKINMRYVRVLDLEDASGVTNDDLKHIVEVFPRLKFLSIRGCSKINHLPKSLGSLRQLQSVDVRDTSVATLPKAILKLQKLQYVRAGTIHSVPWDEGGVMVPYEATRLEEIISVSLPALDSTTIAAAPSAPAKDAAATVLAAPSTPAEDATTVVATPSARASEDTTTTFAEVATTVTGGPLAPAECTTTFAADSWASVEDNTKVAVTPSAPASRDTKTIATATFSPDEVATIVAAAALPTREEDATTSTAAPSFTLAEDVTKVAIARSAPAEEATAVEAAQKAQEEDGKMVATCTLAPVENAITILPAQADDSCTAAAAPPPQRSWPHVLLPNLLSKLGCRSQSTHDNTNFGIEVPAGIGKLTTLQTFGVANVGPGNKAVFLKELHKLTQLRRLSVCGINLDNIRLFFSAIAGLNHLKDLSVRLDKNIDGLFPSLDGTIARLPKTLDACLKLQGHVRILQSSWIKEFADVLILNLEVTLQEQQDMQVMLDHLIHRTNLSSIRRLCIKPIQDGELHIGINDEHKFIGLQHDVLEIVCTTNLQATIGNIGAVDVLRVHCSSGCSLQLSGLQAIRSIKEVWLKGSCRDTLKQDLQRQLAEHQDKPILKVLQPRCS